MTVVFVAVGDNGGGVVHMLHDMSYGIICCTRSGDYVGVFYLINGCIQPQQYSPGGSSG